MRYAIWGGAVTFGLMFVVFATEQPFSLYVLALQFTSLCGQFVSGYFWHRAGWI